MRQRTLIDSCAVSLASSDAHRHARTPMSNDTWREPTILATLDRSYGDKKERLQLEQGEYQGKKTFALRVAWLTPDGQWRWSAKKPTSTGKYWDVLNLKERELRELGEALIAAAEGKSAAPKAAAEPVGEDDIPF